MSRRERWKLLDKQRDKAPAGHVREQGFRQESRGGAWRRPGGGRVFNV